MNKKSKHIGVIDAGFGGLSVIKYMIKKNPELSIKYISDPGNMPYNIHDEEWIAQKANNMISFLKQYTDQIIIACNTISSVRHLLNKDGVEIVDIIDPVVNHLQNLNSNRDYFLFGTKTIINSGYYNLTNSTFINVPCINLATYIQRYGTTSKEVYDCCQQYIEEYIPKKIYKKLTVILACTDYIYIKDIIEKLVLQYTQCEDLEFINTGEILADSLCLNGEFHAKNNIDVYLNDTDSNRKGIDNILGILNLEKVGIEYIDLE